MDAKEAIMNAIKLRGISQRALAEQCGYKRQSNFSSLMSGKSMTVSNFVKLMDALGYDVVVKDRTGADEWVIEQTSSLEPNNVQTQDRWVIDLPRDAKSQTD